jgi:hypothetical protein
MSVSFNKTGVVSADMISEGLRCPFDNNIYTESDGSSWIRIAHHNNPAANLFNSADPFTFSVYKNANNWFCIALCDAVSKWELMIIQAAESSSTATKYRWIQTVNPMNAVYGDVDAADVTKITTTGYTAPAASYGGLYKKNATAFILCNNGTESNSWGRFGDWSGYQGGTAAYNSTVVKSGYVDLYLRIDNTSNVNKASVYKDKILANSIIEV